MIYRAVTSTSIEDFNIRCNSVLEAGFVPIGSISVTLGPGGNYTRYTQAFTYENSNNRQSTKQE